ncbi:MAG: hypothetical protein ACREPQ_01010 [Rhodanobacter sp.]
MTRLQSSPGGQVYGSLKAGEIHPELILPWPDGLLSPNERPHWRDKHPVVKAAREQAWGHARLAGWHHLKLPEGRLHLWLDFYPPTLGRRDDDNLVGSMKPARDGIAQALGIDDSRFKTHPDLKKEVRKGGEVRIRITAESEALNGDVCVDTRLHDF